MLLASNRALRKTPPEVWLSIFEEATYCPEEGGITEWKSNHYDPLEFGRFDFRYLHGYRGGVRKKNAELNFSTRRSLATVCRSWRRLTVKILYRSIIFTNSQQLEKFSNFLRTQPGFSNLLPFA
jgi:hypothetical protein